jgi:hypothetical protein
MSKINFKSLAIIFACCFGIVALSYGQVSIKKFLNIKTELPNSDFKTAFGAGANVLHTVGFVSNRSTRVKGESIDQSVNIVQIKLGETETLINGQLVKHAPFVKEFEIKGFSNLSAETKNADFSYIKMNVKNGIVYSITLLRFNNDYVLFE